MIPGTYSTRLETTWWKEKLPQNYVVIQREYILLNTMHCLHTPSSASLLRKQWYIKWVGLKSKFIYCIIVEPLMCCMI